MLKILQFKFIAICIANLFFFSGTFLSNTLLPIYLVDKDFEALTVGFIFGISAVAALGGRLISGWAVDYWGTKWFLIVGAGLWVITSPFIVFTEMIWFLLVIRILQGLGIAFFMNGAFGFIMYTTPEELRGTATSWFGITNNLAAALGPLLAAFLLFRINMTFVFILGSFMAFITMIICIYLPKIKAYRSTTSERPRIYVRRAVLPGILGSSLALSLGAFMILAPLRAQELGYTQVGIFLTIYAVSMILIRLIAGTVADKKGRHWVIIPGLVLTMISFFIIGWVTHPLLALLGPILLGLGAGVGLPGFIAWSVDRAKENEKANAASTFYIFYEVGLFLGSAIVGLLLQEAGWESMFIISVILFISLIAYSWVLRKQSSDKLEEMTG